MVLPLDQVQALNKDLWLSPMAIKIKHNWHLHVIVDHTWFSVNDHTIPDLPHEVMQFGGALPWILWLLWHANPTDGPFYLSKYDITDGFYCLFIKADDALWLAVTMPHYDNETQLIAVPLSLTMGWTNSPPTFCAASETAANLANDCLAQAPLLPHRMEPMASSHDAWALSSQPLGPSTDITLLNRQSAVNTLQHGQSTINMLQNRQSAIITLGDPLVPNSGDPMVPTRQSAGPMLGAIVLPSRHSTSNTLRNLMVPNLGNPLVPTSQSTGPMLRALMLPPCHLAPEARPPLLLHSGPIAHVDVFIDDFIGLTQGSPSLCQHVCNCILHAIN